MDFWQSLALLGRRWVFFGTALLLAVALTAGVFYRVKPQYQATTNLLLVPPSVSTQNLGKSVSPYDAYGDLNTVAAIVSDAESSQAAQDRLQGEGVTSSYTASPDPTGDVPEVILTVTASSPASAIRQDQILANDTKQYIYSAQQVHGVDEATLVTTQNIAPIVKATKDDKSRIRVGVAVGIVLFFLAVALTFMYDAIRRRKEPAEQKPRAARMSDDVNGRRARADVDELLASVLQSPATAAGWSPYEASGTGDGDDSRREEVPSAHSHASWSSGAGRQPVPPAHLAKDF